MTAAEKLENGVSPIVPVRCGWYDGKEKAYAVYLFDGEVISVFANGEPILSQTEGTLHLYTHANLNLIPGKVARQIVSALRESGFRAWLGTEMYEHDTGYVHRVIHFNITTAADGEELPDGEG